jgi:DNA repair exonuclease SbcCD ATPase subunit
MNLNKPSQKLGASGLALGAALLLAQLRCEAAITQQQEQQQSQSQQQPPPPPPSPTSPPSSQPAPDPAAPIGALPVKRRKVWTNDEVEVLRTPADSYQVEKEAKQAADAEVAAKEAAHKAAGKSEKEPPLDIKLPATPEETKKMLKSALDDIQEETVVQNKLQKELLDAPAAQQADKQKEIDRLNASLETLRRNVKALQDHLQTFPEKPQGENPPAATRPPPA